MKVAVSVLMMITGLWVSDLNGQDPRTIDRIMQNLYIDAGLNSSTTTNHEDYDRRAGLTFGVGTILDGSDLPGINNISVLSDLRYDLGIKFEQFGSKWGDSQSWEGGRFSESFDLRFTYLSFPLLVQYVLCEAYLMGGLKPRFLVGGTEGWKITTVFSSDDMETKNVESGEEDIKDDLKTLDFGLVFGAGYPFNWRDYNFRVEAKYEMGLRDIWDGSNGSSDFSLKNNNFSLTFAWQLGL
ncbi:MAG: porin family protein [Candidatus Neomarinimicrobiota bacterium]